MTNTISRITSLEEHRNLLRMVLETAKSRVLIVSPFISSYAISQDNVAGLVKRATGRGVTVDVYTDDALNLDAVGDLKQAAKDGVSALLRAGARVIIVHGIHNKTLAKDDDLIAEGSFNWLSAVRTRGGIHQREERTMVVKGKQANNMIHEEMKQLNSQKNEAFVSPTPEIKKMGLGLQIFRWVLVLGFLSFMLVVGFGAKERGVSILAFACAGVALYLAASMLKGSKKVAELPVVASTGITTDSSEEYWNTTTDDTDESFADEYTRAHTDAGYVGIYKPF